MARENTLLEKIDSFLTGGQSDRERESIEGTQDMWDNMSGPSVDDLTGGTYNPLTQGPSNMAGITTDPRYLDAANRALQGNLDISSAGGLTAMDKARMAQSEAERSAQERAIQQTASANARMRGASGGGLDEMRAATQSQGGANAASMRDLQMNAQAMQRADEALNRAGSMGQSLQGQQFGQMAAKASAQDVVDRFNTENMNQGSQFNIQNRARAQQGNFDNRMGIMGGRTNARGNVAGMYGERAGAARDFWGNLLDRGLNAATQGMSGMGGGGGMGGGSPRQSGGYNINNK